jgi:hypothetical protein
MVKAWTGDGAFNHSLLEFPAVLFPIISTAVYFVAYASIALWLIRATFLGLSKPGVGTGRCCCFLRKMQNHLLVLLLGSIASVLSVLFVSFRFVPTVAHDTICRDNMFCNLCAGAIGRLLGAACDSLWFSAAVHLVAFWLECLTSATFVSVRPVMRSTTFCWLSLPASVLFALARTMAAIAMPISQTCQMVFIGVAMCLAQGVLFIGTFAMVHFWCSTSWRDALSGDLRLRVHRMSRFLAVSGFLFVLLSVAMSVFLIVRASTNEDDWESSPLTTLAWDAPKRVCRLLLYFSLAFACHSFSPSSRTSREAKETAPSGHDLHVGHDRAHVIAAARNALSAMHIEPDELDVIENVLQRAAMEDASHAAASVCVGGRPGTLLHRLNMIQDALAEHVQLETERQAARLSVESVEGQGAIAAGVIAGVPASEEELQLRPPLLELAAIPREAVLLRALSTVRELSAECDRCSSSSFDRVISCGDSGDASASLGSHTTSAGSPELVDEDSVCAY